jgi:hypothetical protein
MIRCPECVLNKTPEHVVYRHAKPFGVLTNGGKDYVCPLLSIEPDVFCVAGVDVHRRIVW